MSHIALLPSTRILLGLSLIVLSSALESYALLAVFLILGFWLFLGNDLTTLRWIRRARYLLIIPPILSGYVIAGTGVLPLDVWAPTWEGLALGATQSLRLLVGLLALRVALRGLSSSQMATGFMRLLSPLSLLGLNVDQAARRLLLTLLYIDRLDGRKARDILMGIHQLRLPD